MATLTISEDTKRKFDLAHINIQQKEGKKMKVDEAINRILDKYNEVV